MGDTTARGLLMPSLRLRPRLRAAMAVATTARGPLMPSLRLMPLLRLSPVTAMAAMVATVVVMVATATARGLLSLATAMVAMVATGATAMATGVSYHQIRRSELSQKQNHKNSQR